VVFSSDRAGATNLFSQAADGTGTAQRLTQSSNNQFATTVSPDGTRLVFDETVMGMARNLMVLALDKDHRVQPLVPARFTERNGEISRDGRWLAYESDEFGQFEIYVRPFPDVNRGRWQVSTAGGTRPLWAPTGQELFYVAPTNAIMSVRVERGATWTAGRPVKVSEGRYFLPRASNPGRTYDVSADGRQFLMIKSTGGSDEPPPLQSLIVVQNWTEELKRLVPHTR
jgi:serine/threonine-protein kinase